MELFNYKQFLESNEFDINDTDKPDVESAKENLNKLKEDISYYKSNKSSIESLYKKDDFSKKDLDKIITKNGYVNTFLSSYASICASEKRIRELEEKETNKKIEESELNDRLKEAEGNSVENIKDRISKIQDQIKGIQEETKETHKKVSELEDIHKEKMDNVKEDMEKWVSKIQ